VLEKAGGEGLLSNEHFSVDGTLLEAWASLKSFRPRMNLQLHRSLLPQKAVGIRKLNFMERREQMRPMPQPPILNHFLLRRERGKRRSFPIPVMCSWRTEMVL
jgi:hypothetical protein